MDAGTHLAGVAGNDPSAGLGARTRPVVSSLTAVEGAAEAAAGSGTGTTTSDSGNQSQSYSGAISGAGCRAAGDRQRPFGREASSRAASAI